MKRRHWYIRVREECWSQLSQGADDIEGFDWESLRLCKMTPDEAVWEYIKALELEIRHEH